MRRGISAALVLAAALAAGMRLCAQAPSGGDAPAQTPNKPAASVPQSGANPFPEDTTSVPVLPVAGTPVVTEPTSSTKFSNGNDALPGDDADPVRSPDDAATEARGADEGFSSSLTGLEKVLPPPDEDEKTGKKRKLTVKEPTHKEAAATDIGVGGYYLEKKNWKAALSRFESAMVLDPENPEVYWGLAESAYHLGNLADARNYYLKVLDYDPDGPHGKQLKKILKDSALMNAKPNAPVADAAKP
jgi:tetratricopeptide (TPR) repeat protein